MSSKVNRKSASKWEQNSERALIEVWIEKINELRGCRKNSHILLEMVAELQAQGYTYTAFELKTKMHNMTARYRKEKQKIGTTGGSPSDWNFFKEMDALLAPYKSYNCEGLVIDSINHINSTIVSQPLSPNCSTVPLPPLSPLPSPSTVAPSPMPTSSITIPSPLPSPTGVQNSGSAAASSTAGIKRREIFNNFFTNMENKVETMQEDIKKTSERVLAIEEEKKEMLKAYIDREAEVQKALIEFLKRP